MVKLVFLCRRRPDLSHARYVELLLRGHVPIALAHHPTLRRYVVNVVEGTRGAGLEPAPALDSIGELWFDSLADYRERLYDSPEGARVVAEDVKTRSAVSRGAIVISSAADAAGGGPASR